MATAWDLASAEEGQQRDGLPSRFTDVQGLGCRDLGFVQLRSSNLPGELAGREERLGVCIYGGQ